MSINYFKFFCSQTVSPIYPKNFRLHPYNILIQNNKSGVSQITFIEFVEKGLYTHRLIIQILILGFKIPSKHVKIEWSLNSKI